MRIRYHSVVLFVGDIERAKRFYCDLLGIQIGMDMGANVILEGGITLWQMRKDHLLPQKIGLERIANKGNGFELYFETEDIQATCGALKSSRVTFLHEIHEEPWGQRTIRFFDPDDNIVEIGETLKTFLLRMKEEGLPMEQVITKTGMKEEDIINTINQELRQEREKRGLSALTGFC